MKMKFDGARFPRIGRAKRVLGRFDVGPARERPTLIPATQCYVSASPGLDSCHSWYAVHIAHSPLLGRRQVSRD